MLHQRNEWEVPEPLPPSTDTVTLEAAAEVLEEVLDAPHNNVTAEGDDAA